MIQYCIVPSIHFLGTEDLDEEELLEKAIAMSLEGEIEEEKNENNVAKDKPMQFKGEAGSNHLTKDYFSHRCCTGQYCNLKL